MTANKIRNLIFASILAGGLATATLLVHKRSYANPSNETNGIALLADPALQDDLGEGAYSKFFAFGFGNVAWLGVQLEDVTPENMNKYSLAKEQGAIVVQISKDSPAERAGLRENDVILSYSDIPVLSAKHLTRLVSETPPGRTVSLVVSRDGQQQALQVKLEKRTGAYEQHFPNIQERQEPFDFKQFRFFGDRFMRPRLGASIQDLTPQLGEFLGVKDGKGVLVTSVIQDSAAARGGLKAGDVIVGVDNEVVATSGDLFRALQNKREGGQLTLKVVRDRKPLTLPVQVEAPSKGRGVRARHLMML